MNEKLDKGINVFKILIKEHDLLVTFILSSLSIFFIFHPVSSKTFNNIMHIILFYILPGYLLTTFIFPKKNNISILRRFSLFFMFSIVIFTSLGLLLSLLGLSVNNEILAVVDYIFIIIITFLLIISRRKISSEKKFTIKKDIVLRIKYSYTIQNTKERLSFGLLFSLLIISIVSLLFISSKPVFDDPFTEVYLLGPDGETTSVPINFTLGQEKMMIIRVINHMHDGLNYSLQVLHSDNVIQDYTFYLRKEKKVDINFSYNPIKKGIKQMIIFRLYEQPDILVDELKLYINVF